MELTINPRIIKACKEAGIKVVRVRTPGRNKGRFGWCAVVNGVLERSSGTYSSEALAFTGAYYHYTSKGK